MSERPVQKVLSLSESLVEGPAPGLKQGLKPQRKTSLELQGSFTARAGMSLYRHSNLASRYLMGGQRESPGSLPKVSITDGVFGFGCVAHFSFPRERPLVNIQSLIERRNGQLVGRHERLMIPGSVENGFGLNTLRWR